ncbi:MAG TPA: translation initiation factor IF-2, partial [Peptococcaceae bacterium]|nr:translation initiation factor IF-2 [Peptococcaceae bacterium]
VLIQNGILYIGDQILVGIASGKVRAMYDFKGNRIEKASPGTPVEILGLSEVPAAGDLLYAVDDERLARQIAEKRFEKKRQIENVVPEKVTLEELFNQIKEGKVKELNLVVKADVRGSAEALIQALEKMGDQEVRISIIHSGVGGITETDVMLASASNALVIGFNVRPDVNAKEAAETENVEIMLYRVIYEALDDIKAALEGLLEPIHKEVSL